MMLFNDSSTFFYAPPHISLCRAIPCTVSIFENPLFQIVYLTQQPINGNITTKKLKSPIITNCFAHDATTETSSSMT